MPKIVDHDQQRAVILDRGFAAFAARGYGNLTMRDLAGEIDMSFGALYHYFPSKDSLFHALLERYFSRLFLQLPVPENLSLRESLMVVAQQLQANERELAGCLALTLDYVQVRGRPFITLGGQTLDDLLETRVTQSLRLTLPQTRLFRQQVIGLLLLRRLTPNSLPLGIALQPLIDLIAPR